MPDAGPPCRTRLARSLAPLSTPSSATSRRAALRSAVSNRSRTKAIKAVAKLPSLGRLRSPRASPSRFPPFALPPRCLPRVRRGAARRGAFEAAGRGAVKWGRAAPRASSRSRLFYPGSPSLLASPSLFYSISRSFSLIRFIVRAYILFGTSHLFRSHRPRRRRRRRRWNARKALASRDWKGPSHPTPTFSGSLEFFVAITVYLLNVVLSRSFIFRRKVVLRAGFRRKVIRLL